MNAERLAEYRACLSLRHCLHIGPRTWKRLLDHYGCARDAADDVRQWCGLGLASVRQVESYVRGAWEAAVDEEHEAARKCRQPVLLYDDPRFPDLLRRLPDPPLLLYYSGAVDLLRGACVAVVGSRSCSGTGISHARRISAELSGAGVTVVSGLAWGIDRQAHLAGLDGPGSSIAVLGTGLDRTYPPENADVRALLEQRGLLVSEFAPGTGPAAQNFPYRNRIVSGLSLGVVVVEAARRSGSRITARMALEQGREVYAVPGPDDMPSFDGCRGLLDEGATPAGHASDILRDLAPQIRAVMEGGAVAVRPQKAATPHEGPKPEQGRLADALGAPGGAGAVPVVGSATDAVVPRSPARVVAATGGADPEGAVQDGDRFAGLDEDSQLVVDALRGNDRVHIDTLSRDLGWPAAQTSSVLLLLEVQGLVHQWPGMEYSLE
ncbi:hypothetical protein JCM16814_28770 [Desulfobaculum senezii]